MKKIIVVLISLLLLTGCTIDYNLVIDKDSIKETITGTAYKEEYEVREEDSGLNLFYTYINDDINPLISGDGLYTKDINEIDNGINYKYVLRIAMLKRLIHIIVLNLVENFIVYILIK